MKKNNVKDIKIRDGVAIVDLALALSNYDNKQLKEFCDTYKNDELYLLLEEAERKTQIRIINMLDNDRILKIFSKMSKDDIVDILGALNAGKAKELINIMKDGDRTIIKQLLKYRDDCAGGRMTTEYIKLKGSLMVSEAISKIKEIIPKTELIDVIYVVNSEKELIGTIELRDLLVADEETKLEEITNTHYIFVTPETDQEEVAILVSKYDLKAVPVLNKKRCMLGIITIDDIVDVMVEEYTEDILKMGGASKEESLDSNIKTSIKLRLPWLFINLLTAFLASLTVKQFEGVISQVIALSSIMSIIAGMGGNSGNQAVSIIIRNIAIGKVKLKDVRKYVRKEFLVGLIDGLLVGVVAGIVVALIYHNIYLGIIVLLAMICNLIISCVGGTLIPLVLHKLKMDPALSSSIFLTTATDVLGFLTFLTLAKIFLPYLI